jgi:hypothetical protein
MTFFGTDNVGGWYLEERLCLAFFRREVLPRRPRDMPESALCLVQVMTVLASRE